VLIDTVSDLETLAKLKRDWDSVYDADPEAQLFLSWTWMSKWVETLTGPWFVLAARPHASAPYVAFLPLRLRLKERRDGGGFYNEINMAGNFGADYTGFICRPEFDEDAIPALGKHMRMLHWTRINFDNIRTTQQRLKLLLAQFPGREFVIDELERINHRDNVNNCLCPFVTLPASWDSYLSDNLSANTRQKLRRFLRQIEADPAFRITHGTADTFDRDLRILLRFWAKKWGPRKGQRLGNIIRSNYNMLKRSAESGMLFLPVLWREEAPLGALASLVDAKKKALFFYIGGRDEAFNDPPPGMVLHAHSIRHAIGQGLTTYDFLRGNEPYKFSFGSVARKIDCIVVATKSGRNLGRKLDPRTVPDVLERAIKYHQDNELARAERAYRQVLDSVPAEPKALYCLAQLMAGKGRHGTAIRLLKALTAVKPNSERAWLRLGRSYEVQRRFMDAANAYRKIVELTPGSAAAHNALGHVLLKIGKFSDAASCFEKALALEPDSAQTEMRLAEVRRLAAPAERHPNLSRPIADHAPPNASLRPAAMFARTN
jgi:tetratricopeptide (TPR) repeat protein